MDNFKYTDERFADIQMLRYRLDNFEKLSLKQKLYIYCLAKATLCGRDITTDQFGKYNLRIRKILEAVYVNYAGDKQSDEFQALDEYLHRVWFANGIYHHYACDKFETKFDEAWFHKAVKSIPKDVLPLKANETLDDMLDEICPVMFDKNILPKRVNKRGGDDLVQTSACNYYDGVSQTEVETFYNNMAHNAGNQPPSYGLNSTLIKCNGEIREEVWNTSSRYGNAIKHIVYWLEKAIEYAENDTQKDVIKMLTDYYTTGDLKTFDKYSILWLSELEGQIDFINGFIEVYGDPLGIKASWEGIVTYKDLVATKRTQTISTNAQWFEDHSPVDSRFRKAKVVGVVANVVCSAMLGGDEYPSTAIGINLPNADWIRAQHGSKSITIGNLTHAYNMAAQGNGFLEEFVGDADTLAMIKKYGNVCDDLHTDLHECLGHGSGQLLPGVKADALSSYADTIEEARADLFGLYYMADAKMLELGLIPHPDAYKAHYYTYMMNGLLTQLTRIKRGCHIEEAHMRNRSLIAHWVYDNYPEVISLTTHNGKTLLHIANYDALRNAFATLLAEIQRIKSEGDYVAAKNIVERYGVKVDALIHEEILQRYEALGIAPYKGFINPQMLLQHDTNGNITDVTIDYTESYEHQMLRYSVEYGFLI